MVGGGKRENECRWWGMSVGVCGEGILREQLPYCTLRHWLSHRAQRAQTASLTPRQSVCQIGSQPVSQPTNQSANQPAIQSASWGRD